MKREATQSLPNIFPSLGPVVEFVLFADFDDEMPSFTSEQWVAEYPTLLAHGLAGVAYRTVRARKLSVPTRIVDHLQAVQFDQIAATADMVKRSSVGIRSLAAAGIPFVVTKGPGIATEGMSVADRPFIDLDLVVAPSQFKAARRELALLGYFEEDRTRQPWESFNLVTREAVNLRSAEGGSIDLHHRISPWLWSTGITFDVLSSTAQEHDVFRLALPLASPELNLLVTALHVVSDKSQPGMTYRAWRDLLMLVNASAPGPLADAAARTDMSAWLAWILGCLPDRVRPRELIALLSEANRPLQHASRLRMLLGEGAGRPVQQLFRIPVPKAILFTAGTLVPSREYLRVKYPGESHRYLARWRNLPSYLAGRSGDESGGDPSPTERVGRGEAS